MKTPEYPMAMLPVCRCTVLRSMPALIAGKSSSFLLVNFLVSSSTSLLSLLIHLPQVVHCQNVCFPYYGLSQTQIHYLFWAFITLDLGEDPALVTPLEFALVELRASGGGAAELWASSGNPVEVRVSDGGLVEVRASSGGPVELRASSGGPT
ncbi:hypothetical protein MA16_Dca021228 [Dendrobium catenatum]|uniref:Uncharacterized protein n=1 Tax=Dendrobium catenatum TaxID=906689 RepID=A0A2I0VDX2_9ASPA|nr:hypothetical protein MA16_Dca021228 [Dendrobium catenatum]